MLKICGYFHEAALLQCVAAACPVLHTAESEEYGGSSDEQEYLMEAGSGEEEEEEDEEEEDDSLRHPVHRLMQMIGASTVRQVREGHRCQGVQGRRYEYCAYPNEITREEGR